MDDREKIIRKAVELLEWFQDTVDDGDAWSKGFRRGVEHLAEMLVGEDVLDWRKLQREAVKK